MSISSVTSEALQLKLRQLLPSQQGFGTDLSAQDTIVPIIDLTAAAEGIGETFPQSYLQALAFGSQTSYTIQNTTTTVANTAGFWRVNVSATTNGQVVARVELENGGVAKKIWSIDSKATSGLLTKNGDFIVYLDTNDTIQGVSNNNNSVLDISVRNIATTNGVAINPSGFAPQ